MKYKIHDVTLQASKLWVSYEFPEINTSGTESFSQTATEQEILNKIENLWSFHTNLSVQPKPPTPKISTEISKLVGFEK